MKIYYVYQPYFDGDNGHGYVRSPNFSTRELAEEFLEKCGWGENYYGDTPEVSEQIVLEVIPEGMPLGMDYYLIETNR